MPITLRTFSNPMDAHLLKGKLESEGIWCEVHNENATAYAPTPDGIKLVILEKDIEKAREFINQSAHHLRDKKRIPLQCPHCNSTRYEVSSKWLRQIPLLYTIVNSLQHIILGHSKSSIRCKYCSRKF